jgi:hypothetical protein
MLASKIAANLDQYDQTGTGKAARQRGHVYGRITDGTLFPNISARIVESVRELGHTTFASLQENTDEVFDLIKNDLDMALASGVTDERPVFSREEIDATEELRAELLLLRTEHAEVLDSVTALEN